MVATSTLLMNGIALCSEVNECSLAGRNKHTDIRFNFVAQTIADNKVPVRIHKQKLT